MLFVMNLWTTNTILSKMNDAVLGSIHGIGFTEFMVLHHLKGAHHKTMRRIDLAQKLGLTASGITRLVAPMEKIGLVEKEANPRDARVSLVKITKAGETILADASISLEQKSQSVLEGLDPKILNEMTKAMEKLTA